jgi:potassium-transporting ATPase KdpC subunit
MDARYSNGKPSTLRTDASPGERTGSAFDSLARAGGMKSEAVSPFAGQSLWKEIRTAVLATLALALLLCGIYPLAVWGLAQLAFPHQANGSLVIRDGHIVGSALIGQNFTSDRYFHPRPSAAGADGYDAASSGGSNLGPLSQKLMDQVKERAAGYRAENGLPSDAEIPGDTVTASGSGLDPHISVRNAMLQAARVARARGIAVEQVHRAIDQNSDGPQLGFLGERGVNVLKLNLALDTMTGRTDAVQ